MPLEAEDGCSRGALDAVVCGGNRVTVCPMWTLGLTGIATNDGIPARNTMTHRSSSYAVAPSDPTPHVANCRAQATEGSHRDCPMARAVAWGMMADLTQPQKTVEDTAMSIRRAATALLLSGVAVVAMATPAFADTELKGSTPSDGESLGAPKLIVLSFTGHVTLPANPITVTGGNGASWTIGKAAATGPLVTAPVRQSGPAGPYTLNYQVISDDGDAVTGTISFTIVPTTAAPPPKTTTPPSPASSTASHAAAHGSSGPVSDAASTSDSGGIPAWVWILCAVVVLAIGVREAIRVGRSRR
jgi:methionine-rich copper-binding protein CopC